MFAWPAATSEYRDETTKGRCHMGLGLTEIVILGVLAVLLGGGVFAVVFLMNRTGRNDDATHGGGNGDSGSASYGD
jgi:hypothetical protein